MAVLPQTYLRSGIFRGLYTGRCHTFLRRLTRPEPAAFALPKFVAHAYYNLSSFGIPRMGASCLGSFPPAPCSPPLGGSIADSAVRFTPAVKYGGRENRPSGRATRCMSGHPCRAHHILKWARKFWGRHPASVFDSLTIKEFVVGLRRHNPQVQYSLPCICLKFHVPNMR